MAKSRIAEDILGSTVRNLAITRKAREILGLVRISDFVETLANRAKYSACLASGACLAFDAATASFKSFIKLSDMACPDPRA